MLARLRKALDYNPMTGVFRWKIKRANMEVGERAGNLHPVLGYRTVMVDYKAYYEHRLAWAFVHGKFPRLTIDHVNGKRDDNRIKNLRVLSNADNVRHRVRLNKNNKSGVNGVWYDHTRKKWTAKIVVNRRQKYLGRFATFAEAKAVREAAQC